MREAAADLRKLVDQLRRRLGDALHVAAVLRVPDAARHLAGHAATRFGLRDRGALRVGGFADVAVVDPARVVDEADYADPCRLATGVDDVTVNGVPVLRDGELTGASAGRALRHGR